MFQLLGPVGVVVGDRHIDLGSPKQRIILAVLLVEAARPVGVDVLIDRVWDEAPVGAARRMVSTYVSRLRRVLEQVRAAGGGHVELVRRQGGYQLLVAPELVDLHRFRRLVAAAEDWPQPEVQRAGLLRDALGLWHGTALSDLPGAWAQRMRQAWHQHRLDATVAWARLELRLGHPKQVISTVRDLVTDHPLVEPLAGMLIQALDLDGRTAEALDCFATTRRRLVEELGVEPGAELRAVHETLLQGHARPTKQSRRLATAPELAGAQAPLRNVPGQPAEIDLTVTPQGNLPLDIAIFVGREAELARACELLSHVRLVTLTGPGGVGKTRLALRIAGRLQASVHDAAWIIDLGALHGPIAATPERLYAHMALALGIRHQGPAGLEVLLDHIRSRRVLLVLDNCEHLVAPTKACVSALLRAAPHLRVLATSRQALGVDGEHILVVPPLALPDAIELFTVGATAAGADIVARADARVVAELCCRLDGLPLAIRLAASRARTLSVPQLLHRLDDRFRLLTEAGLLAGADSRQRHCTLERVVDWSYELCTEAEQQLWARASVFARAFDLEAIEAVCGDDGIDPASVVDLVTGLVDKSVLTVDNTTRPTGGPARYYLLDTLRDYGLGKLDAAGDTRRVRNRHRIYYRDLVADTAATWLGPAELDTMAVVHQDLPDVLAAIDESVLRHDLPTARAICRDLVRGRSPFFWGFLDLIRQQLHRVIDMSDTATSAEQAVDLAATAATTAWVAATQGDHDTAQALLTAAHDLHHRWDIAATAPVLFAEGSILALGAGGPTAIELLAAARDAFDHPATVGDQHMATMMWAIATAFAAEPAPAVAASEEYLRQAQDAKAPWAISWALWVAALAALHSGDHQHATDCIGRSLRLQRDMDDQWGQTWSTELCAWIIAARLDHTDNPHGDAERAAWLLGAAQTRQHKLGVTLAGLRPLADGNTRAYQRIATVLGEPATTAAMTAGSRGHSHAVRVALSTGSTTAKRSC